MKKPFWKLWFTVGGPGLLFTNCHLSGFHARWNIGKKLQNTAIYCPLILWFVLRLDHLSSELRDQKTTGVWESRQGKLRQLRTHWEHIKKKQPLFPTGKWNSGWPGAAAQTFTAQVTDLQMHLLIITQRSNSILGEHRPQLPSIKDLASRNLIVFLTPFVSYKFRLSSSES